MDYQKILIGTIGTLENGAVFTRKQIYDSLMGQGYAERTAHNALTPSRKGGMINALLADGVVEPHGPRGYRIVDNRSFKVKPKPNAGRVTFYEGTPRQDYRGLGQMSDTGAYEVELLMCGERFAAGCWNLKLYADGKMAHKANWWMQYRNGALSGNDAATLKATKPDVYANIIADMKEIEASYDR